MLEVMLVWTGLGLYVACAFGALAAGIREEERPPPKRSQSSRHA